MQSQSKGADRARPFTLFGLDIYLVSFLAIGGAFILVAVVWIFFTRLPMPQSCGGLHSSHFCGWISRDPNPSPSAPR
jgi:hypothetical protein